MLQKLWIKGLRNLNEFNLDLCDKEHLYILGQNNQGKTNFLEGIFLLGNGHSPVTSCPEYVVNFDEDHAIIGGDIWLDGQRHRIYVKVYSDGKRDIIINEKKIRTYSHLKKYLNIDFLSADILHTYTKTADFRRKDFDKFATSYSSEYKNLLKRYERVLKQKNRALKQDESLTCIGVFNEQLVSLAYDLVLARKEIFKRIEIILLALLRPFDSLKVDTIKITYLKKSFEDIELDKYKYYLKEKLDNNLNKEKAIGYSLYGPHRDDYDVIINGKSLFNFYSRGINRIVSVLMKVTQLRLIQEKYNTFPMLLLDDTFAELDLSKKEILMRILKEHTCIIYTTVVDEDTVLFQDGQRFLMSDGELIRA